MDEMRAAGKAGLVTLIFSLLIAWQPLLGAPSPAAIGTVNGRGLIRLNGIAAPPGAVVYAGNEIATGPGGVGYIALAHGGKLVLDGASSAQLNEGPAGVSVKLGRGVVAAMSEANAPIVVTADGVAIRSKQAAGAYEVSLRGNELKVLASHGSTLAEAANRTIEVPEGKIMSGTVNVGDSVTEGQLLHTGVVTADKTGILSWSDGEDDQGEHHHHHHHHGCISPSQLDCD